MSTLSRSSRKSKGVYFYLFLLFVIAGLLGASFFLFFEGEPPQITINSPQTYIGMKTDISFAVNDTKSGIKTISATITQGDVTQTLFDKKFSRRGYTGIIGKPSEEKSIILNPKESGFSDGDATLVITTTDYSFRNFLQGNQTVVTRALTIDTTPPKINILHSERYIYPGGTGIVIYKINDPDTKHGLFVNGHFNKGFLVGDGRDDTYITYFGLPYDTQALTKSFITSEDPAGNKKEIPFSTIFKNKNFKFDRINVGDNFLNKKIPEFEQSYPEMKGDSVEKYLYTNNEVRTKNNNRIKSLCDNPYSERLWSGHFGRMAGSTRANFADHRTYYYKSQPIDKQVHLGIDIASTKNADIKAAEKGKVIHSDYLGIYGNMVMLDHGQGIFSLYSHLSQINVAVDDIIEKGVVLGQTGTSGMAGGDHLHFSMLVNGIFVTPKEWWDQNWINVTIEDPLTESRF